MRREDSKMLIKLTDPATRQIYRRRAYFTYEHDAGLPILRDDCGETYSAEDWIRLDGRVVYAAPHERKRFPDWLARRSAVPADSGRYVAYENDEICITERTEGGCLVVTSSGRSTLHNAAMNSTGVWIVGNLRPDRVGMVLDLSGLASWQVPAIHAAHLRGWQRHNPYAGRLAVVCSAGIAPDTQETTRVALESWGGPPTYCTTVPHAIDYLHSLPPPGDLR
jgi:hypothetical protein